MCSGEIFLASTWHKKSDVSVAAFSFTTDTEDLLALARGDSDTPFKAENTIVTASNGAWPKPENIQDWSFDLYEVSNSERRSWQNTQANFVNGYDLTGRQRLPAGAFHQLKTRGWNPAS